MTTKEKLRIIVQDLLKYEPDKIILFGSAARGESDAQSDIDILLLKRTDKPFVKRLREVALLCRLNEPIDILVYTPEEMERMKKNKNAFIQNVLSEGRILYERQFA